MKFYANVPGGRLKRVTKVRFLLHTVLSSKNLKKNATKIQTKCVSFTSSIRNTSSLLCFKFMKRTVSCKKRVATFHLRQIHHSHFRGWNQHAFNIPSFSGLAFFSQLNPLKRAVRAFGDTNINLKLFASVNVITRRRSSRRVTRLLLLLSAKSRYRVRWQMSLTIS